MITSWFKKKLVEHHIGSECDDALYRHLIEYLESMGATKDGNDLLHVGSQDITIDKFIFNGDPIHVVRETYVGLSIVSTREVVEMVIANWGNHKQGK